MPYLLNSKMRQSWETLLIIMMEIGNRIEILNDLNRLACLARISKVNTTGKIHYGGSVYLQDEKPGLAVGLVRVIWDLL